jgi:hypothetical protein
MMSSQKKMIWPATIILTATALFIGNKLLTRHQMEKYHILKAPLSIGSDKDENYYILPSGTYLYFDSVFPEGFTRYKIYVNIKENLPLQENTKGVEAPLTAESIDKNTLIKILKNVKLDKEDVKSILTTGQFSDAERREIADAINRDTR